MANYEEVKFRVPEGARVFIKLRAEQLGLTINAYVNRLFANDVGLSMHAWWNSDNDSRANALGWLRGNKHDQV
jgi:hypothetical protein